MGELSGILKNALERGWEQNEIKRSLINAGYTVQEVESEFSKSNLENSQKIITEKTENSEDKIKSLQNYQIPQVEKDKSKKRLIILSLIILIVGLIAATSLFLLLKK